MSVRAGVIAQGLLATTVLFIAGIASSGPPAGAAGTAVAVDPGGAHTCAVTDAGVLSCWGWNFHGQLGDSTLESRLSPTIVPMGPVSDIAAGGNHTCALTREGAALCWGLNDSGQLGDGGVDASLVPVAVCAPAGGEACTPLRQSTSISAGSSHTCVLSTTGAVLCWGANESGQLGDGTTDSHSIPVPVCASPACPPLGGVASLALGSSHSCALSESLGLLCWGNNGAGQLGDGQACGVICPTPVAVCIPDRATCASPDAISSVSAGGSHTCAVTVDRHAYCWGDNAHGQLGEGSKSRSNTPMAVSGLDSPLAIAAGLNHTCALSVAGDVSCWGLNSVSQLGNGSADSSSLPVPVEGLALDVVYIAAGSSHTCAVGSAGSLQCWGWNADGRLGDGTFTGRDGPVDVVGFGGNKTAVPTAPAATPSPTPSPVFGDANCDGSVSAIDAVLSLQFTARLIDSLACPELADANASGRVDSLDAALILQFVAGIVSSLPP